MNNLETPKDSAQTDHPKVGLTTEHDFLDQQAEDAKAAIARAFDQAKHALAEGVDPKLWAKRYPLIALGSAVAAGFAAAALAIPSKEQHELRKIRKVHEALHPSPPQPAPAAGKTEEKTSFLSALLHESLHLVRPLLTTLLSSSLAQVIAPTEHSHNGDHPSPPASPQEPRPNKPL